MVGRRKPDMPLAINTVTRAVLAAGFPSDHEAAVFERRHRRIILIARSVGVDLELIAEGVALRVITLAVNTITRTILTAGLPGDHETVTAQTGHRRVILRTTCVRIGLEQAAIQRRRIPAHGRELLTEYCPTAVVEPGTQLART